MVIENQIFESFRTRERIKAIKLLTSQGFKIYDSKGDIVNDKNLDKV